MRFIFPLLVLLFLAQSSHAHRLIVEATSLPGSVKLEAYYGEDDTPAQKARVSILKDDVVILTGLTDDKGVCVLEITETGELLAKVESLGHAAKVKFVAIPKDLPVEQHEQAQRNFSILDLPTWLRVGLGFLVIALIGGVGYLGLRRKAS